MIAIDTSSLVAFLAGEDGDDVEALDRALELSQAVLPPVVLTEILSAPGLEPGVARLVRALPVLETSPGFWERAAMTRAKILERKLRARLADSLISQSCLDHKTALVTRDRDFRHFVQHVGLQVV